MINLSCVTSVSINIFVMLPEGNQKHLNIYFTGVISNQNIKLFPERRLNAL